MRETVLARGEMETRVLVTTPETGTLLLDEEEEVLESHDQDQHEAILARLLADGWEVEEDGP
jgi:hypothetical protein